MEYLHENEINSLLRVAYDHNREHHLALLVMYGTGTRVSQALRLKGIDVAPDPQTGGYKVRVPKAKRGKTRSFRVLVSPNPILDMTPLIELAKTRGTSNLFGGLTRHYLHVVIKKYALLAGLHEGMVHCHTVRHSTAMRIYERTQRIGAVTGFLCHSDPAAGYTYVQENDGQIADKAMQQVFASA
jgi:site-specific recombinase XerD